MGRETYPKLLFGDISGLKLLSFFLDLVCRVLEVSYNVPWDGGENARVGMRAQISYLFSLHFWENASYTLRKMITVNRV